MTNAWFLGAANSVPQDEAVVRSTIEPIRDDGESAELQSAPEWNAREFDNSGELTGLSHRMKGSDTRDTEKFTPWWLPLSQVDYSGLIDGQVSSSGTAAARESAGQAGHGTMQYAIGLEPEIRDGGRFGNDYFVSAPLDIQEGAGHYMSPPDQDNWLSSLAQDTAEQNSRKAYQASLYQSLLT